MNSTIKELKSELIKEEIKQIIKDAYQQGIEDSKSQYALPFLLTKRDLSNIFQVKEPTVNKIIARRDFPKSEFVAARYPRDEVFKWIESNSKNFNINTFL